MRAVHHVPRAPADDDDDDDDEDDDDDDVDVDGVPVDFRAKVWQLQ